MFSDAIAGLHKRAHASLYSLSFFFFRDGSCVLQMDWRAVPDTGWGLQFHG